MHNNMFVPLSRVTCLCGKEISCLTLYVIMHIEDWKSLFVPQWNQMTPKTQKHSTSLTEKVKTLSNFHVSTAKL